MKTNKIYRHQMREALKGKWCKFFLIVLVYELVVTRANLAVNEGLDKLFAGINNPLPSMFFSILLIPPLFSVIYMGIYRLALSVYEGEHPSFSGMLLTKNLYSRGLRLKYLASAVCQLPYFIVSLPAAIWSDSVALIVIAVVGQFAAAIWMFKKMLDYSMSDFVLLTEPHLSAKEILREARMRIRGHRWQCVRLMFSIIVWCLVPTMVIASFVENEFFFHVLTSFFSAAAIPCSMLAGAAFFKDLEVKK